MAKEVGVPPFRASVRCIRSTVRSFFSALLPSRWLQTSSSLRDPLGFFGIAHHLRGDKLWCVLIQLPLSVKNCSRRALRVSFWVAWRRSSDGARHLGQLVNQSWPSTSTSLRGRMVFPQEQYLQVRVNGGGGVGIAGILWVLDEAILLAGSDKSCRGTLLLNRGRIGDGSPRDYQRRKAAITCRKPC